MSKTIKRHVSVINPENREAVWFQPGDSLPKWAENLVTNPAAFEDESADSSEKESMITQTRKTANYGNMNISMLDELLKERDLSTSGNKRDKVERLKQSDGATS